MAKRTNNIATGRYESVTNGSRRTATSQPNPNVREEVRRIAEKGIKKHEETWKELAKH